jgi:adenylate cyclase
MSPTNPTRRLVAILASDVVGYTQLMGRDEFGTLSALETHRQEVFDPLVAEHGGRIVKLMGDGALVEFGSVVSAVRCAVDVQAAIAELGGVITLRIGIHLGDVMVVGDDLYGDGVNIAARLESIAPVGGVCVSSIAFDSLRGVDDIRFEDGGIHELKNVDTPMRTHVWHPTGEIPVAASTTVAPAEVAAIRPSIAVLAFENRSGQADQDFFSDGIAEDLITALSSFSELFVIARSSSFAFKDDDLSPKEIAARLGVDYLATGTVRRAGDRVRVTAALLDASSGRQVWADNYDRELADIFDVQDDVVRSVVAVLPGRIADAHDEHARRKPTNSLGAYEHFLRGNHVIWRRGPFVAEAIEHYARAIELDPEFAPAHAMTGIAEGMSIWDMSRQGDNPVQRAWDAGRRALDLDASDYLSHAAFGQASRQRGDAELAHRHLRRALDLNPNSAQVLSYWAMYLAYSTDPAAALDAHDQAVALDPYGSDDLRTETVAEANFNLGRHEDSISVLRTMLGLPVAYVHQQIAINFGMLGDLEARDHHFELYQSQRPSWFDEMELFESHMRICQTSELEERWRAGYRLVGLDV